MKSQYANSQPIIAQLVNTFITHDMLGWGLLQWFAGYLLGLFSTPSWLRH